MAGVLKAGAFEYVIVVSPQVLSDTAFAAYPVVEELFAKTRKVAWPTLPARFPTLKRI
jgi:hypothetical protein